MALTPYVGGGVIPSDANETTNISTSATPGERPDPVTHPIPLPGAGDSNGSIPFEVVTQSPCQWILYYDVHYSGVRLWDVMILVPNALFLAFLLFRLRNNVSKLQTSSSPIFTAFYGLVFVVSVISVLRCIVSMTVNASVEAGDIADKMLWLLLRFFLLGTEASVIIFGIYFGHLDSRTSIRRVLICTSFFALVYSTVQGTLEMNYQHSSYSVSNPDNTTENFDLFAHGGMIFLCTSSSFFCLVYCVVLILPLTSIRERFTLPTKRSFYYYVGALAGLNFVQAIGSLLMYQMVGHALCVIDVTTYVYFTLFDPLVYGTFLWNFFRTTQTGILFSYKHQVDDIQDEDQLSLPYQTPFVKADGADSPTTDDFGFGSTHFDRHANTSTSSSSPTGTQNPYLSINSDVYQVST
ncbi:transmembrane protein adipocyte-associated 1 homolog [Littorina saxatilis]|uniref:Transmembrane protein adipocyte-associated 1 homolog n=1 Tax=Littorina saxatilis TaxID=31220 RepID=A0AAN9GDA3_9CAEN